jgi:hypothetical protein
MLISVALVIIGIWTGESVYSLIGFIFIFFLSVFVFMPGQITYYSSSDLNITVSGTSISGSITDNYSSFDDSTSKWFGRWLAIISVIGFVMSLMDVRSIMKRRRDDD